jgi:8-oxo-dGTP pyrophosphatase MutT (NUDIX family)
MESERATSAPQLDREEIRRRLAVVCPPEVADVPPAQPPEADVPRPQTGPGVPAAVLIGLVAHDDGPTIILTERTEHLSNHPGQISFPGGRIEPGDAGPADGALREAFEEIGLDPGKVELLGCLPVHTTITNFHVYPIVGWMEPPLELTLDAHEVAAVFECPLAFVLDPANHRLGSLVLGEVTHTFYVLEWAGHRIWGATAGMLVTLARTLS